MQRQFWRKVRTLVKRFTYSKRGYGRWVIGGMSTAILLSMIVLYCLFRWNIICLNASVENAIEDLCEAYQNGKVFGNLCDSLCQKEEITILNCQSMHKGKSMVFTAKWKSQDVVIKSHKTEGEYIPLEWNTGNDTVVFPTSEEFHEMVTHSLRMNCGLRVNKTTDILGTLFPFISIPSILTKEIMINMWQLIQNSEYVLSTVYAESNIFPKLLGSCGTFYAAEFVTLVRELDSRGRDGNPLLQLIHKLDSMLPERLEICDVKLEHFGLARDGALKILDADTVFVKSIADRITSDGRTCQWDSDCHLFDCHSSCNLQTNRCDRALVDSNLDRVCRRITPSSKNCN